jgi:hypothetical protein
MYILRYSGVGVLTFHVKTRISRIVQFCCASYVITSQGKMADAMGFSVECAERPLQANSILL